MKSSAQIIKTAYAKFGGQTELVKYSTNINHKGLQRTANEYVGERRIYKDLISKNEK